MHSQSNQFPFLQVVNEPQKKNMSGTPRQSKEPIKKIKNSALYTEVEASSVGMYQVLWVMQDVQQYCRDAAFVWNMTKADLMTAGFSMIYLPSFLTVNVTDIQNKK